MKRAKQQRPQFNPATGRKFGVFFSAAQFRWVDGRTFVRTAPKVPAAPFLDAPRPHELGPREVRFARPTHC
jgi:hypothetical protein